MNPFSPTLPENTTVVDSWYKEETNHYMIDADSWHKEKEPTPNMLQNPFAPRETI